MGCVFCDIANGKIKSEKIYEDEFVVAFKDLEPMAPVHFLVIPKKHIENLNSIESSDFYIFEKIFRAIKKISAELKLNEGFRVVNNCGEYGGQTVFHMHFHVLGKRRFTWPPG